MRFAIPPGLIATFRTAPQELFRVNYGLDVKLRVGDADPRRRKPGAIYDIFAICGMVEGKARDEETYQAPNGASMRPNSPYQQRLVRKGNDKMVVYAVPAGTPLPEDLILVHERTDHYSLQPGKMMTSDDLNAKLTDFMRTKGRLYTRAQWMEAYPRPTAPSGLERGTLKPMRTARSLK